MKSKRFPFAALIAALISGLSANPLLANEISSGFEAQVRLPAGEVGVTTFQGTNAPYVPATPYGYLGYKLEGGMSFGLGLAFDYFKVTPPAGSGATGWTLMLAPTAQIPFMRSEQFEMFGVARFILTPGSVTTQLTAAQLAAAQAPAGITGSVTTPLMTYGGNLGVGGTWYATSHFGFGAEVGAGLNYLTSSATPTIGGAELAVQKANALYLQSYFALTASYVM